MNNTIILKTRIEESLNKEVEDIFQKLGLTMPDAINIFYHQVRLRKGLPFEVTLPNKTTLKTFKDTDTGNNLVKCKNTKDLFKKLNI